MRGVEVLALTGVGGRGRIGTVVLDEHGPLAPGSGHLLDTDQIRVVQLDKGNGTYPGPIDTLERTYIGPFT